MLRMILIILGIAVVVFALLGQRGQISSSRPRIFFWDMKYQPKYTPQGESAFFADGRASRMPVPNTIPYGSTAWEENQDYLAADGEYYQGIRKDFKPEEGKPPNDNDKFVRGIPAEVLQRVAIDRGKLTLNDPNARRDQERRLRWEGLLELGRERYTIHCAVCHGDTGYGGQGDAAHGMVGRKGMNGIASYHQARLRKAPDGYLFDVITNGKNSMSAYGHQVQVQYRWAIVAYVRALQLSQDAGVLLNDEEKARLSKGGR